MQSGILINMVRFGDSSPMLVLEAALASTPQQDLNPAIFTGKEMKSNVRTVLLKLANDFYTKLGLPLEIQDIQLTGSTANFNWTPQSDVDLHILVNFTQHSNPTLLKKFGDTARWKWNLEHAPMIGDFEVEVYLQDVNEPHVASGLYSIQEDHWLVEPTPNVIDVDTADVNMKASSIRNEIEMIIHHDTLNMHGKYQSLVKVKEKISKMRKAGLASSGELSVENLAFKQLRNGGTIESLLDTINATYDQIHSINE